MKFVRWTVMAIGIITIAHFLFNGIAGAYITIKARKSDQAFCASKANYDRCIADQREYRRLHDPISSY